MELFRNVGINCAKGFNKDLILLILQKMPNSARSAAVDLPADVSRLRPRVALITE